MAGMRIADGCDVARVARGAEPVPDGRPDRAACDRAAVVRRRLSSHEQHQPRSTRDRLLKAPVEEMIGGGEIMSVEVDGQVGLNQAAPQPPVPASVQRLPKSRSSL